jgi:hypothetical protein
MIDIFLPLIKRGCLKPMNIESKCSATVFGVHTIDTVPERLGVILIYLLCTKLESMAHAPLNPLAGGHQVVTFLFMRIAFAKSIIPVIAPACNCRYP